MAAVAKDKLQLTVKNLLPSMINDNVVKELVNEYTAKYSDKQEAARKLVTDCSQKGTYIALIEQASAYTKLPEIMGAGGGFVALVYTQLYMVLSVAAIAGYDIRSNEVQTRCYECLATNAIARALRPFLSTTIDSLLKQHKINGGHKLVDSILEFTLDWIAFKIVGKRSINYFILGK